jgi:uncharacterized oxidoreductase
MKLQGNTIFITGGGSGIGRGLAEALHKLGNKVIIAGRRQAKLDEVVAANPGIDAMVFDASDPASIEATAAKLMEHYPDLNVLINNAGVMARDQAGGKIDDEVLTSEVTTNLLGPIRLTSALIDQIKSQQGTIIYTTSILAFVPLTLAAVYSATKAAIHSYILSQRVLLKDSGVRVLEIAPPRVASELMKARGSRPPMPLDAFIAETMKELGTDKDEILIEGTQPFRNNPGPNEIGLVEKIGADMLASLQGAWS